MRTTVANFKASRLPAVLNLSPEDPRALAYLNEAIWRLVATGEKFHGLYGEFQFCVDNGCITLNRQIAQVEAVNVCGQPMDIRSPWFKYLGSGPGDYYACETSTTRHGCGQQFSQKAGDFCTYRDIIGTTKKLKIYADVSEDADAKIT